MSISVSPAADPAGSPARGQPDPMISKALPFWIEILLVVGVFILIKLIPGLPYSGPIGIAAATGMATVLIRRRGQSWADLGMRWAKTPGDYLKGAAAVVVMFVAAAAVNGVLLLSLPYFLGEAAERAFPDLSTLASYLVMMVIVWTTAAFCEEMVCRGFLMSRMAGLLGEGRAAWIVAAFGQAVLFGFAHAYQGIGGIITTAAIGLLFGLLYLAYNRNLWPLIIGHGLINSFGITVLHLQATGAITLS